MTGTPAVNLADINRGYPAITSGQTYLRVVTVHVERSKSESHVQMLASQSILTCQLTVVEVEFVKGVGHLDYHQHNIEQFSVVM